MKRIKSVVLVPIFFLLSPMALNAEEITVTYEGVVDEILGSGNGYAIGDAISGSFSFYTEDLVDVNEDGSYFESDGPVSSDKSATVEIYPENFDTVRVWNFEQNGYDQLLISDATIQYDGPFWTTMWHTISLWDHSELLDLENLPVEGLSFSDSDVEYLGGNIAHRTATSTGLVQDKTSFYIESLHIGLVSPADMLDELLETSSGQGPGDSLSNKIILAQTYLEVPDEESACLMLGDFLNQVRAQRGKKLTEEQADQFSADAVAIMDAIGCD